MQDKIELKACPHCGGEATLASPAEWPYLTNIVFCPSCLAKGPQGPDFANAIAQWMLRFGAEHPAEDNALTKACPYCAWEEVVEVMVWVMSLGIRVLCTLRHARIVWRVDLMCATRMRR